MTAKKPKRKYGVVILLDALGASRYTEEQIKQFLSSRSEINSIIKNLSTKIPMKSGDSPLSPPTIYTFGDTLIITVQLRSKKYIGSHIYFITLLMRRYLFHSLQNGILFRGAFSIGN